MRADKTSISGFKAALAYGEKLKKFKDAEQAERYFLARKDKLLKKFEKNCAKHSLFLPDYSVESLKKLEKIYFNLCESDGFAGAGFTKKEFESAASAYFGEVVVRNNPEAKFEARAFPFSEGKYEFYVSKGLLSMAIDDKFRDLDKRPDNVRRNSIFREYNKYFK